MSKKEIKWSLDDAKEEALNDFLEKKRDALDRFMHLKVFTHNDECRKVGYLCNFIKRNRV